MAEILLQHERAASSPGPERSASNAAPSQPQTAVVGVSGYAGGELARLLLGHPRLAGCAPIFFGRPESEGPSATERLDSVHPQLADAALHRVVPFSWDALQDAGTEVIFFATPHEQSRAWVPEALDRGFRVVDLSGAWRLHHEQHRALYDFIDEGSADAEKVQREAVYGCPELDAEGRIATARLVANPGCYATSALLALAPLLRAGCVDRSAGIVCDAKSGVSGAGKAATAKTHFMYAADNLSAYSVFGHRHTGELIEQLGLHSSEIRFTPHLLPIPRGILSSIYLRLNRPFAPEEVEAIFTEFYQGRRMVRVRAAGVLPQIQHVVRTSFCDLGFALDGDGQRLFVVSCLDNLLKGAAGQAVQNMNLLCGWQEWEGLL